MFWAISSVGRARRSHRRGRRFKSDMVHYIVESGQNVDKKWTTQLSSLVCPLLSMKTKSKEIGQLGEEIASTYLKNHRYKILDRNYTKNIAGMKFGELDIVAKKKDIIVFVEVKTKKSDDNIDPEDRVNSQKRTKIAKMAEIWLNQHKVTQNIKWQIDVIAVNLDLTTKEAQIRHFENI